LELSFANKPLRQLCESSAKANRKLGVDIANELRRRVADLRAATSARDLLIGAPREIQANQITLDVGPCFKITFCANHNTIPKLESGAIDWSKVSRVKILAIESKDV
jgi:toxin HigB-1